MLVKEAGFYNICVTVDNGTEDEDPINYYYADYTLTDRQMDYDTIIDRTNSYLTRKVSGYEKYYISPIDTYTTDLVTNENGTVVGIICTKS